MLVPEVNTDIVGCQKGVIFIQKGKLKVEMVHRTQVAPVLQPGSTNILLILLLYPVISHVKNLLPLLPIALHLPQIPKDNLESPHFLPSFLHFSQPRYHRVKLGQCRSFKLSQATPSLRNDLLLLFPDLPPVSMYHSWLPGHDQQYLVLSVGQQQGHRDKKGPPTPWDHIFVVPLSQKLCCPALLLFKVAQVPQTVSLPESSWALHPKEGTHIPSAFPGTLAALAQTEKIRSEGYLQCLPSVPFPILLPKDTVGPISVPIKKLHLVPWGDGNSD